MELCPASHPLNIHRLVCPLGKRRSCARRVSWDNPSKDQLRLEPLWAPRQLQYPLAMNVQSCLEYQKTRVFQRPLWASKGGVIGDGVSEEGGPHWEVPYSNWGYPGNPQLPPGRGMVSYPPYLSACTVARKGVEPLFGAKLLGFAPSSCCSERR
jgi:hypothetical protein